MEGLGDCVRATARDLTPSGVELHALELSIDSAARDFMKQPSCLTDRDALVDAIVGCTVKVGLWERKRKRTPSTP